MNELIKALRAKYKTPGEVLLTLGLDRSLLGQGNDDPFIEVVNLKETEMTKKQRLIAAKADARKALSGVVAQDADLSLLDKLLARLAMDAESKEDDDLAEDDDDEDQEGDSEEVKAEKAKRRAAKAGQAADDDAPAGGEGSPKPPEVTKAAMDSAIAAAVSAATAKVKADMEALHVARKEVAPMVGEVALDSAEAVYKFALDHAKVDVEGVHPSAYRSLVKMAGAPKAAAPAFAQDAAAAVKVTEQFPQLARFNK